MLPNSELRTLLTQLKEFRRREQSHHDMSTNMMEKFENLVRDYKILKSDHEEKEAREKCKPVAKGKSATDNAAFVLVLVDGDAYVPYLFEQYISGKDEGGFQAGLRLYECIQMLLHEQQLQDCNIMVKVYSDLASLSRKMAFKKLAGHDKRSLSPFVAGFSRSKSLFDFIDVGDGEQSARVKYSKIEDTFCIFDSVAQCKHIFFAACNNNAYIPMLESCRREAGQLTLIKAETSHSDYHSIGLNLEDVSDSFKLGPSLASTSEQKPVPWRPSFDIKTSTIRTLPASSASVPTSLYAQQQATKHTWQNGKLTIPNGIENTNHELPLSREGLIPVNKHQQRIDTRLAPPTTAATKAYNQRPQRPCNNLQLNGSCAKSGCTYDHRPVDEAEKDVMRSILRNSACRAQSACRSTSCYLCHTCIKPSCYDASRATKCKIPAVLHVLDLSVAEWVPEKGKFRSTTSSTAWTSAGASVRDDGRSDRLSNVTTNDAGRSASPDLLIFVSSSSDTSDEDADDGGSMSAASRSVSRDGVDIAFPAPVNMSRVLPLLSTDSLGDSDQESVD